MGERERMREKERETEREKGREREKLTAILKFSKVFINPLLESIKYELETCDL